MPEQQLSFDFDAAPEELLDALLQGTAAPEKLDGVALLRMIGWILSGRSELDVIAQAKKTLGIEATDTRHYLRVARRSVRKPIQESRAERLARMVRERQHARAEALADGDHRTALAIQKDINHLLGDYPDKVIRNVWNDEKPKSDKPVDIKTVFEALPPAARAELRQLLIGDDEP